MSIGLLETLGLEEWDLRGCLEAAGDGDGAECLGLWGDEGCPASGDGVGSFLEATPTPMTRSAAARATELLGCRLTHDHRAAPTRGRRGDGGRQVSALTGSHGADPDAPGTAAASALATGRKLSQESGWSGEG